MNTQQTNEVHQPPASEVAALRKRLEEECNAMRLGLSGYAAVAKHQTIEHRYDTLGDIADELAKHIGPDAHQEAAQIYMRVLGSESD